MTSSGKWQATLCPSPMSRSSGRSVEHRSGLSSRSRSQHRVWNRQPDGGLAGDGTSPLSTMRLFLMVGSGSGTADIRLTVYGCSGVS